MPAALEALILRMLAKKPEERPQGMREVLAALEEISPRTSGARPRQLMTVESAPTLDSASTAPPATAPPAPPAPRGARWPLALGGGIVLATAVALGVVARPGASPPAPAPAAPPDAGALIEYRQDAITFHYSPVFKLERWERDPVIGITLDSPRSPLVIVQIYRDDIVPEAVTLVMEARLEDRLKAKGMGFKLLSKEPVRRRLGTDLREGERLVYDLAGVRVTTEIYAFQSGLTTYAFLFQSAGDDEAEAAELFRVVAESFRINVAQEAGWRPSDAGTGR